jgi:AcrR family transcriptional regulator
VPDSDKPEGKSTEALLIDAAADLFAAKGFAAIGVREIARQAGVTIGAHYHYASSKEELFMKLMRRSYARAELRALGDEFEDAWRRIISEGISEGTIDPEDPSTARLSII